LVLVAFLALLSASVYFLYQPASKWVDKAPQTLNQNENKVREKIKHVEIVGNSSEKDKKVNVAETNTENSAFETEPDLFKIIIHRMWSFVFGLATMLIFSIFSWRQVTCSYERR
jgi:predicted PurR-regulated permease PerM